MHIESAHPAATALEVRRVDTAASITPLCDRVLFRITVVQALVCALVCLGAARVAGQAATGRIEGQVRLVLPPASAVPSGVYPSRRVSRPQPKAAEISNVIVFLKDAPHRADPAPMHVTIAQKDEAFVPRVVAITRGSTIDFPNSDPFFHNVFSLSRGANFDLGRYPRGESRSRRFPNAGLVKVYCHIHSHMTASIMVFDHPYFRIPASDGAFTLDDVPAGTYQISAWHERIGESLDTIRVDAGRTARVEFALPMDQR
jgi:plastocyanin